MFGIRKLSSIYYRNVLLLSREVFGISNEQTFFDKFFSMISFFRLCNLFVLIWKIEYALCEHCSR